MTNPLPGQNESESARKLILISALIAGVIGASAPAASQSPKNDKEQVAPADPCQAQPDDQDRKAEENGPKEDRLSAEALQRCKGTLKPPKTDDQEIEKPAPDTGTTPVIPPGTAPDQPRS